ncbi:sugar kinase [Embleya scabrispora]|uniref:sugar kinase n=1 Tax=Embleya scabrispora TaxID=159449 RepID=UPI000476BFB4|nr:sugar kinase [Embleya scabrispora]MYS84458.1 sugar kinase [Streptomyces sp. SID5474]
MTAEPRETPDVVTLGETMVLLTAPHIGPLRHARTLDVATGGAETNLAIGITRLGGRAAWIGRVGDDEFGRLVLAVLGGEGLDTRGAVVDPDAPTGLMVKARRTSAATDVRYYRAGSAGSRLCPEDVDPALVRSARILHITGITPALSATARAAVRAAVAEANGAGVPVSLDLNYRQALWSAEHAATELRALAAGADILFATEDEARLVLKAPAHTPVLDLARDLGALGPTQVLLKQGSRGAVAIVEGRVHEVPPHRVDAVDSVGAGDAFAAGYLAELVEGGSVAARLATAAAAGAFAVTVPGDWEGLPRRDELRLLQQDDAVAR